LRDTVCVDTTHVDTVHTPAIHVDSATVVDDNVGEVIDELLKELFILAP